jgi:imidazolonepropionase-like amidohydrolase
MSLLRLALALVLSAPAPARPATPAVTRPPAAAAKTPARAGPVYLVGGELHVGDGAVIPDSVVAMDGGVFTVVGGADARGKLPTGAPVVDVRGRVLTPGLFGADTTLGLVEIDLEGSTRDDSRGGDPPIRAAYDAASAISADSSLLPVQVVEGVTSAAVTPTGGVVSGQVAVIDLVPGDHRGLVAAPRVAVAAHLGQAFGGSRAATLAKLREVLADARIYPARKAAVERAQSRPLAAHPLDLEALQPALKRQAVVTVSADRASDILAALDLAREFGLRIAVVGGAEAWKVADELARAKVPVVLQPTQNLPGSFDTMGARLDNAALLHQAGAEVVITILGDAHNLRNLRQEAGNAVAHGLPWAAALTAVTLGPARAYGVDRTHGSVAAGKVANLVVWSGDPLELASHAVTVYVRGVAAGTTTRQTLLRDRYRDLTPFQPRTSEKVVREGK